MSEEVGSVRPNPYIFDIENRRKRKPRLAHDLGAGAKCNKCGDKCPGFELHFWRKICQNCRCGKDDHEVEDEDEDIGQVVIGKLFERPARTKKEELEYSYGNNLEILNEETGKAEKVKFDWVPPNVNKNLAARYMSLLPPSKRPVAGSEAAKKRRKQLEQQLPLYDMDETQRCDNMPAEELQSFMVYLDRIKTQVAGQGLVQEILAPQTPLMAQPLIPHHPHRDTSQPLTEGTYANVGLRNESFGPGNESFGPWNESLGLGNESFGPMDQSALDNQILLAKTHELPNNELYSHSQPGASPGQVKSSLQEFMGEMIQDYYNMNLANSVPYGTTPEASQPLKGLGTHLEHGMGVTGSLGQGGELLQQMGTPALIPPSLTPSLGGDPNHFQAGHKEYNPLPWPADYSTLGNKNLSSEFNAPGSRNLPSRFGAPGSKNLPSEYGAPGSRNLPSEYGAPGSKNLPSEYGTPLSKNLPPEYGTPGSEDPPKYGVPGNKNLPPKFGAPGSKDLPLEYDTHGNTNLPLTYGAPGNKNLPSEYGAPGSQGLPSEYGVPDNNNLPTSYDIKGHNTLPLDHEGNIPTQFSSVPQYDRVQKGALPGLQSTAPNWNTSMPGKQDSISSHMSSGPYKQGLIPNQDGNLRTLSTVPSEQQHYVPGKEATVYGYQISASEPINPQNPQEIGSLSNQGNVADSGDERLRQPGMGSLPQLSARTQATSSIAAVQTPYRAQLDTMKGGMMVAPGTDVNVLFPAESQVLGGGDSGKSGTMLPQQSKFSCQYCSQPMNVGDVAVFCERAGPDKCWHPSCFACFTCQELLADLIYFYQDGKVYCGRHFTKAVHMPRCTACDELIFGNSWTHAEEQDWHLNHFCCFMCDTPLAGLRYVPDKEGCPYCLPCYKSYLAKMCEGCEEKISPEESRCGHRGYFYHGNPQCFSCHICKTPLIGKKFKMSKNWVFCSNECIQVAAEDLHNNPNPKEKVTI